MAPLMRRNWLILALACALLAAAAASLMSQTLVGPAKPSRAPAGYGSSTKPPQTAVPPTEPGTTCPCYTAASIQAVFDTCGVPVTKNCLGADKTLQAYCTPPGPPATNLGAWIQLAGAGECRTLSIDIVTGEPVTTTQVVNGTQRADCTAILVAKCP